MTHRGYEASVLEIMSFVPSAITTAVVEEVRVFESTEEPAFAVRPILASTVALFHVPRARSFDLSEPNASVPTVRLSPTTSKVPCPLGPIEGVLRVAAATT